MKLNEMLEQVQITCRMRRLSWQTEQCYAGWIARFARHVARCGDVTREEKVRLFLEHLSPQFAQTITSPLDALPQMAKVVPFENDAAGRSARAPVGRRAA